MGNKSSKYGMPNLRGLVDMKDGKKKKNSKSKPGDDADDIAQFMFDGDMEVNYFSLIIIINWIILTTNFFHKIYIYRIPTNYLKEEKRL